MQKKDTEQILLYYGKIEKQLDSVLSLIHI
mgnify:CR=1 FL=1